MRLFAKQWLIFVVVLKPSMYAQQMPVGSYQDILKNTLGLPRDLRQEVAKQSGGAISWQGSNMRAYQQIAQVMVKPYAMLTADILPNIKTEFLKQLQWLMDSLDSPNHYDGPNYFGVAIESKHKFIMDDEDWGYGGGSSRESTITIFEMSSGKVLSSKSIPNSDVSAVAIAPMSNDIIAYAIPNSLNAIKTTIYWFDVKNTKQVHIGEFDGVIQRLQFHAADKLYVLCNKKLYVCDIAANDAVIHEQTIKDTGGMQIPIEDFVINKANANIGAAIMNSGLYLLNVTSNKFKKISQLPPADNNKLAFFENQIAVLSKVTDGKEKKIQITIAEPSLYSVD